MESPNRTYVGELDELRGFAALLVYLYHVMQGAAGAAGYSSWLISSFAPLCLVYEGHIGVALFMVLSGFVLARGTFDRPIAYGQFLRNRALRILPLMTVVVLFAAYGSGGFSLGGFSFLYLSNADLKLADKTGLMTTVWTVVIEFQFYLIAPFLFAFVSRYRWRYLIGAFALAFILKMIAMVPSEDSPGLLINIPSLTIVGRLTQFLAGIALAYAFYQWRPTSRRLGFALLAVSFVAVCAYAFELNNGGGFNKWQSWRWAQQEIEAVTFAGLIAGYSLARPFDWPMGRIIARGLQIIGLLSFSIYILHWPVITSYWKVYNWLNPDLIHSLPSLFLVTTATLLPLVLALSALSYFCIERPFLNLRRRYIEPAVIAPVSIAA